MQTQGVLEHAWPLLATFEAARRSIPIVCVLVEGGSYSFADARDHLEHLEERLSGAARYNVASVLESLTPIQEFATLQMRLYNLIPSLISVVYSPKGTANELAATALDIQDKQVPASHQRANAHEHTRISPWLPHPPRTYAWQKVLEKQRRSMRKGMSAFLTSASSLMNLAPSRVGTHSAIEHLPPVGPQAVAHPDDDFDAVSPVRAFGDAPERDVEEGATDLKTADGIEIKSLVDE